MEKEVTKALNVNEILQQMTNFLLANLFTNIFFMDQYF